MLKPPTTAKSTARKPLSNISNAHKSRRKPPPPTPPAAAEPPVADDGAALDRLLLAHSDLSNLFSQIDELVAQAIQLKTMSKTGNQDIESFSCVLSDMHSTLKPCVSRFQEAFGGASLASEEQSAPLTNIKSLASTNEGGGAINSTSGEGETDLIVSPSPLVSWRAGACTVKSGRQLFALTPLGESKIPSSRFSGSSKSLAGVRTCKDTPRNVLRVPPLSVPRNSSTELMKMGEIKIPPSDASKPRVLQAKSSHSESVLSPPGFDNLKNRKISTCLQTPSLKVVPSKSCILASDPALKGYGGMPKSTCLQTPSLKVVPSKSCILASESALQGYGGMPKSTCLQTPSLKVLPPTSCGLPNGPSRNETTRVSNDFDIEEVSAGLARRHPELLELQPPQNFTCRKKEYGESLDWFLSPPKTCILMEPSDDKPVPTPAMSVLPATPMLKDFESTVRVGKRPGESTLKRELWDRFDALPANRLPFETPAYRKTERKGFLDMLEEASCETVD